MIRWGKGCMRTLPLEMPARKKPPMVMVAPWGGHGGPI